MTHSAHGATLRALLANLPDATKDVIANLVVIIVVTQAGYEPSKALMEWWNESKEDLLEALRFIPAEHN